MEIHDRNGSPIQITRGPHGWRVWNPDNPGVAINYGSPDNIVHDWNLEPSFDPRSVPSESGGGLVGSSPGTGTGGDGGGDDGGGGDGGGGDGGGGDGGGEGGGGGGGCFAQGTQILMADGTGRNIESIRPGDMVQSIDATTGLKTLRKVLSTKSVTVPRTVRLGLSNGDRLDISDKQQIVSDDGTSFLPLDIAIGTKLLSATIPPTTVISCEILNKQTQVHDLILDGPHNLFAQRINVGEKNDNEMSNLAALRDWVLLQNNMATMQVWHSCTE